MDPYAFLLEEFGILDHGLIPDSEIQTPPSTPPSIEPIYDVTTERCFFGETEWMEFMDWKEPHFAMDYDQELSYNQNAKKKHRYSRKDRFRFTLYQLVGNSGDVPHQVSTFVRRKLGSRIRRNKIWNRVRSILKNEGLRRYYNRIPQIISTITGLKPTGDSYFCLHQCLADFDRFDYQFDSSLRQKWKRAYFPNLRFVALKLLDKYGVKYPYTVPFVRTARKRKYLNKLWLEFK